MDYPAHLDENAVIAAKTAPVPIAAADDLSWAVVKMHAVESIIVNEPLVAAYQAASSSPRSARSSLIWRHSTSGADGTTAYPCRRSQRPWPTMLMPARRRGASRRRVAAIIPISLDADPRGRFPKRQISGSMGAGYCDAWNRLIDQPWRIMTIGRRKWARGS